MSLCNMYKLFIWTLFVASLFVVELCSDIDEDIFYEMYGDLNILQLQSAMIVHNISKHYHLNKGNKTIDSKNNSDFSRIFFWNHNKSIKAKTHYETALFHHQMYFLIENLIYNMQTAPSRRRMTESETIKTDPELHSILTQIGISDPIDIARTMYYIQEIRRPMVPNYPKVPIKSTDKIEWGLDGVSRLQFNFDLDSMQILPSRIIDFGDNMFLPAINIKMDTLTVVVDGDNFSKDIKQNFATIYIKKLTLRGWKSYVKVKGHMIFHMVSIDISNPRKGDVNCDRKVKFNYQTKEDHITIAESWPPLMWIGQDIGGYLADSHGLKKLIQQEIKDEIDDMPCFLSTSSDMRLGVQVPDPYQKVLARMEKMRRQSDKLLNKDIGILNGVAQKANDSELQETLKNKIEQIQQLLDNMKSAIKSHVDPLKASYCKKAICKSAK